MSSIFELSELARPLGLFADLLKTVEIILLFYSSERIKLVLTVMLCSLPRAHHVLIQGKGMTTHLKQIWLFLADFANLEPNTLFLYSSSVPHAMLPLHESLLVVILLLNDLCIQIMNSLCYPCSFPWGGVKLDPQNHLWNENLFESSY